LHSHAHTDPHICMHAPKHSKANFLSILGRKVAKYVGFEVAKGVTVMSEVL